MARKKYKRRPNNVAKKFHWERYKKNGFEDTEKSYENIL